MDSLPLTKFCSRSFRPSDSLSVRILWVVDISVVATEVVASHAVLEPVFTRSAVAWVTSDAVLEAPCPTEVAVSATFLEPLFTCFAAVGLRAGRILGSFRSRLQAPPRSGISIHPGCSYHDCPALGVTQVLLSHLL